MGFAPIAPAPVDLAKTTPTAPHGDTRERIKATAKDFEASFLSVMMGEMFNGVGEDAFSGGQGATMFKSFLIEAMSKQMTKTGGVGVSNAVQREMLKLQGLEG